MYLLVMEGETVGDAVVFAAGAVSQSVSPDSRALRLGPDSPDRGHDAFLLDVPDLVDTTRGFIDAAARAKGIA